MILTTYLLLFYGLVSVSLFLVLSKYFTWKKNNQRMIEISKNVPYPKGSICYPIIGHGNLFMGGTKRIFKSLTWIIQENYDRVCKVWLGYNLFYVVFKPEHLEIVFNQALEKCKFVQFTKKFGGEGLFSATTEKWRKNRKLINPTFNNKTLEGFIPIFNEKSENLINVLLKNEGKGVFDIYKNMCDYNVDAICESTMGISMNNLLGDESFAEAFETVPAIIMERMFNVFLHPDFIYRFSKLYKLEEETVNKIDAFVKKVIAQRKKIHEESKEGEAEIEDQPRRRKALLDLLLELQSTEPRFTDKAIADEVKTFLLGGGDTTSVTMAFILIMLGMFPELQQKVYEEVIEVIGFERQIEKGDVSKLVFLEKFIKETMRLFPVAPLLARRALNDVDLGDCVIPKGAEIVILMMGNHRSEKYFKDPLKFDPERFNPDEVERHPYCYLPFGGGPRNCIGMKHGMLSMKISVANLVRKLIFSTPFKSIEEIEVKQDFIISSIKGYPISIKKRN